MQFLMFLILAMQYFKNNLINTLRELFSKVNFDMGSPKDLEKIL